MRRYRQRLHDIAVAAMLHIAEVYSGDAEQKSPLVRRWSDMLWTSWAYCAAYASICLEAFMPERDKMIEVKKVLVKVSASGGCIFLRTVSRGFRSRQRFCILEEKIRLLEKKRGILATDIHSYACLELHGSVMGGRADILRAEFTWLDGSRLPDLAGKKEVVWLDYGKFRAAVEKSYGMGGAEVGLLSVDPRRKPEIRFMKGEHLKVVSGNKFLRKRLSRAIMCLGWKHTKRIIVYDDFAPYSFFYREEKDDGAWVCGRITLHMEDKLREACYGIHT